ncbi:MAG: hypothetical protein HY854_11845 [Burkholderiales bacterium]|nr:hypothetical protein [Burkholderiales bacterium]
MDTPTKTIDLAESVAGEEDPGAGIDTTLGPGAEAARSPTVTSIRTCPSCGGRGMLGGQTCPECEGTGRITAGD